MNHAFYSSHITKALPVCVVLAMLSLACAAQSEPESNPSEHVPASHVVVIGVDGMSPDGIRQANTPNLDALITRGAHTFRARAVMPSSSSSNWASMIMGAGPERHGVTSNDWEPNDFILPAVCTGPGGIFPTIFSVVRAQRPDAEIGVFHDWDGFGRLLEQDAPDVLYDGDGPDDTVAHAASFIAEHRPLLTFIHLDHVDGAGHSEGHGSATYYAAVEDADRLIGEVVEALDAAGIVDETVIIVSSDHGGSGTGHGGITPDEMNIPWIVAGPSVQSGYEIARPVDTYDTAATVAYLLGVSAGDCWTARPVSTAFLP